MSESNLASRNRAKADYIAAVAMVCGTMATHNAMLSVFIKDPVEAGKAFGDSMKWQLAAAIAGLGKPELVSDFLTATDSD